MMKKIFLSSAILLGTGIVIAQPVINTVSPARGRPGTSVTITGSNFNTTAANNIVYFGATRAVVTGASGTSLTATIPVGATYAPISVNNTASTLTGYSRYPFLPTYDNSTFIQGNVNFTAHESFTAGTSPQSVAIGDLDGDGKSDLVVANYGSNSLSVYLNTSTSGSITSTSFAAKVDFATGTNPFGVSIGDLDGDGKPDLAVANYGSATVSVFRNTSVSGTIDATSFAAKVDFTVGTNPYVAVISDLDGDGKADIAANNFTSATVSLLRNIGSSGSITSGSFAAKVDLAAASGVRWLAVGDLDGDGKPDLATANSSASSVSVFRNISTSGTFTTGSFAARADLAHGSNPNTVTIGDVDGDGKADLIATSSNTSNLALYRNISTSGTISFDAKFDFSVGGGSNYAALGDIDGDGKPDLAIASLANGVVSVFRNTATSGTIDANTFAAKSSFAPLSAPRFVAVGDLDGDRKPDLVASPNSAAVSVFRNDPLLAPPAITSVSPAVARPGNAVTITGTHFNTTAANNIVYFGATKATVTVASATSLAVVVPIGATYKPVSVNNTALALAGSSKYPFLPTFSNSAYVPGSLTFDPKVDLTAGTEPYSVALSDLDGDGKADLAVANQTSNTISVYRNISASGTITAGSFAAKIDLTTASLPRNVAIGDVDGDGKPDLAVTNAGSNSVSVLLNASTSGSLSFAAKSDFTTGFQPNAVAIGDLDGDGKPELAVANITSSSVSVLRNTSTSGSAAFAARVDYATGTSAYSVAIGDLDGDGKSELAVANYATATVSVLRNIAIPGIINFQSFATKVDFTTGTQPDAVAIGDLDGDGKADLAITNLVSNTVSVYYNTSTSGVINTGSFAAKVDFTTGSTPRSLAMSDLDGDGKLDLVVANSGAASVSLFRNTATSGSIDATSFAARLDLTTASGPYSVAIGDLDGDHKPDLAVAGNYVSMVSVIRNNPPLQPVPTITSVSPMFANPGSSVTITGTNFNTTTGNNIVYFGATRATVTSASATSLTVQVPAGASYASVSVNNTSLGQAAYAQYPFLPTFDNSAYLPNTVNFGPTVTLTGGFGSSDVAIGDLDGDGKPDQVVASRNYALLSIFRNVSTTGTISTSSFATSVDLNLAAPAAAVSITDIDGDGKPDLVVAGNYIISVYRNISTSGTITSSSFAPRVDIYTTVNASNLVVSDLDGDGKPDLAVSSGFGVDVFRNAAAPGSFNATSLDAPVKLSTLSYTDLVVGDLDGDGKRDIAAVGYAGILTLIRNISTTGSLSTASFAAGVEFAAYSTGTYFTMGLADIDGDGKSDILLANRGFNLLSAFRNTSTTPGAFTSASLAARVDFATTLNPNGIAIGDFDGDGKPDVAVCNDHSFSAMSIFRNSATVGSIDANSFAPGVDYAASSTNSLSAIAAGDLDADGYPDIVATFGISNSVAIIKNSPLTPPPAINSVNPAIADPGTSVTITGTGFNPSAANNIVYFGATKATVTAASPTSLTTSVPAGSTFMPVSVSNISSKLVANAPRAFLPTFGNGLHTSADTISFDTCVYFPLSGSAPSEKFVINDIDGDGKSDLVVLHSATNTFSIYRNTSASGALSSASFAPKVDFTLTYAAQAVAVGDIDGDGKPDLAFASMGSFFSILRNTSTPGTINSSSFATSVEMGSGSCNNLVLSDLDGDGRLDILVTYSGVVNVYRNLAVPGTINAGSFGREVRLITPGEPNSVSIGDIDGDGKPDVVTTSSASGNISVFRNQCTPGFLAANSFASRVDINIGFNTRSVTFSDFDGDGKLDLAFPGNSNFVSVIRNNNVPGSVLASSFEPRVDFTTGTQPFPVVVADFNGDSKPDIAVLNYVSDNSFTVLRNVSTTGSFTTSSFARKNVSLGFNSSGLAAGDLDADGKPEIVVTDYKFMAGGWRVSVFKNNILDPIAGVDSICIGSQLTLSNATSGGTWNSGNTSVATIGSTGIVTGISAGTATISYNLTVGTVTAVVTVMPLADAGTISGASSVNGGATITLSASVTGGVWSASNANATVSSAGIVTGVSSGTVTISYSVTNGCGAAVATKVITVIATGVSGSPVICVGATTTLSGTPSGGTWSSSNTPLAVVNAAGVVTGLSAGTVRISYNVGGSSVFTVVTINAIPSAFTGSLSICSGATTTIASTPVGGTWTSSDATVGTITASGVLSGLSAGTSTISYALSNGCGRSAIATVNAVPSAISGITDVCVGSTSNLTNAVPGGVFSSGNSTIATVSLTGTVTGIAAGSTLISYSIGGCRVTTAVSVTAAPAITGTAVACVGATTSLANVTPGGVWSSGNSAVADVNTSGLVSAVAAGTATISYSLSAGCTRTQVVTVNAIPVIGGPSAVCIGGTVNLTSTPATTSWASATPAVATINSAGLVSAVSAGTTTISVITVAGCTNNTVISVNAQPVITGIGVVCINNTTSLTASPTGGIWTSGSTGISSVNAATGVITGVNTGTATISYSLGSSCLRTAIVTVNALPAITGTAVMCAGATAALSGSPAGGAWSTADPLTATVSGTGVVTGQAAGTTNIIYTNTTTGCVRAVVATINAIPGAFSGITNICAGTTSSLTNATPGGTWSSSTPAIASAGVATGVISGTAAGAATITYRIGTCSATTSFTVRALPNAILGGMQTVVGATATLTNATSGGTWSSSDPAVGPISATGVVTGLTTGTSTVVYTSVNGCSRSVVVTINAVPVLPGPRNLCVGSTITISSPLVPVSSWTSSTPSVATVSSGIVTGVTPGTSTITYVLTAGGYATTEVTVFPLPAVITGTPTVCMGYTTTLNDVTPAGTWSCSNGSLASIDADGVLTGANAGIGTIFYTLSTGCRRSITVTVNLLPSPITGTASVCVGATMFPYLQSPSAGSWTSSNTAIATVPVTHGAVVGVAAGTATISLTNSVGCTITREVTVSVCPARGMNAGTTSISNLNAGDINISVYPNPTKGSFSVATLEAGNLGIATIDGREVMKHEISAGTTEVTLPSDFANGVYMCRFISEGGAISTIRLVVEK